MKKKSTSQSAFFNLRILTACVFCLLGVAVALFAQGKGPKQTQTNRSAARQDAPGTQSPDVVRMVGPVALNTDLRNLPYIAPVREVEERRLTRYPFPEDGAPPPLPAGFQQLQSLLKKIWRPTPTMPGPLLTFDGITAAQSGCGCFPPDSNGDVGPNHYINAVNSSFRVFDKTGTPLTPATTFNSLFAPLGNSTPCGNNQNSGDPFAFYDQLADRWVISDFAFPGLPGNGPFYQCIAVSQTNDPVAGGWFLYAIQHSDQPGETMWVGDYPKMALWSEPLPGGAYHLTVNLFDGPSLGFRGVRVFALDRGSMLTGGAANAIAFTLQAADVGASYSFVPATFRLFDPPPAGRDEFVLAIDSPATGGVTLTQVHGRLFHVDFVTPGDSTFGVGPTHQPNAEITVDGFVDAFTNTTTRLVPQQGTAVRLDTLGDKIMTPVVYQNRGGTESLWSSHTVCTDTNCTGPTGVRWYQFDVTGGTFPATPVQQQTWTNGDDGLWRWMGSIAVDDAGNTAIGYSVSSPSMFPGIRYAGRLSADPPSDLVQGEATMFNGSGNETDNRGRWGDYTMTSVDPSDGMTFWHVNQYLPSSGTGFNWVQRIGKFDFVGGGATPTPTPTATPSGCTWSPGPDMPSPDVRSVGVFFPANGKFYAIGGRAFDGGGGEFTNPFEYDPVANTWTTKSATYPDNQINNMACGVLNDSGTDYIYCVGGSESATSTTTGRVFRYDPIADAITTVAGGDWPPGASGILPGGFAVFSNQLFTLGGFDIPNGVGINQIWQFTPSPAGWVQKNTVLPVPLGYIPTTTIGSFIYTGGGSDITGGALTDTNNSFQYDPVADSITTIASIPRATGETRALNFNGLMYVMGGGRTAPNPSNEVDIYDPGTDSWSVGIPFSNARRNFPTDTNGTDHIWLAGGYDVDGVTPLASMEIFDCPQVSPTPTPTVTPTPTASVPPSPTPSPTPRPTPTPRPRPTPHPRP
jgi:hypothetical protein